MDYNRLVSVTGMGGLFELISSKADGGVVRSLEDKTTKFVSTRIHSFSHLESIEVFTVKDNVNLVEVLKAMQESKEKKPDAKAEPAAIKAYFKKVYPEMDFERVYSSDMKKMLKWFDLLTANKVEIKLSENPESEISQQESTTPKGKTSSAKAAAVTNAPARKITAPRKMA